jgi:hypothetical protein
MQRVNHPLHFVNAARVEPFSRIPAVGREKMHGVVAPAIAVIRLVVVEFADREQLHDVHAQLNQVVEAGGDVGAARQMRLRFTQAQVLAPTLDAAVGIDREIAQVRFINNGFGNGKGRAVGDFGFVVHDDGAPVMRRDGARVRINQFARRIEARVVPGRGVGVITAAPIAE